MLGQTRAAAANDASVVVDIGIGRSVDGQDRRDALLIDSVLSHGSQRYRLCGTSFERTVY